MTAALRLDATYAAGDEDAGTLLVRLVNAGPTPLSEFRLAFTAVVPLIPPDGSSTRLVTRTSGYHELAPPNGFELAPGEVWQLDPLSCGHPLRHANDGPSSAYVIVADGSTRPVHVGGTARADAPRVGRSAPPALHLADPLGVGAEAWATAAACERRLYPRDAGVLSPAEAGDAVAVDVDTALPKDSFRIESGAGGHTVTAASPAAVLPAFVTLAQAQRAGVVPRHSMNEPIHEWRALHIDLARQFMPAVDVEWLLDVAAWRGLNRLHLHLTDDEGWRVPIASYPALTEVGAWRGHGLPIPPLLGAGAEPYGGSYAPTDISLWVRRAAELGIELIPEIDLPAHSFAALAAVSQLVDPEDSGTAVSVQHFSRNVLNPGVAATRPFLEAVFGELADLFPSPWVHVGGDEVPPGAWQGSPAAQRYAAERGIAGTDAIAAAFVSDIIAIVGAVGRRVGVWQEAAQSGAVIPGDGYVVGWKSRDDCRRLAAAGHSVVAAPAEAFYFDMAADAAWRTAGAGWAGETSVEDVARFDVTAGWTPTERDNLIGIQACLWTEHVHDHATLVELLLPRLDAFAAAGWRRTVR